MAELSTLGAVIKTAYEAQGNTNAFTDAEKAKLAAVEPGATADQTGAEIKALYEAQGNTNAFTDAEKAKLATFDDPKFKGTYANLTALNSAHPTATAGSYAYVDAGTGNDTQQYIWDASDTAWVLSASTGTTETPASIKSKYESNADTNAFTDAEQTKLAAVRKRFPSDLLRGHYKLQVPVDLNADTFADEIAPSAVAGYELAGRYEITVGGNAVKFRVAVGDPKLNGSSNPRLERREARGDGTNAAWSGTDATVFHVYRARSRFTELPGTKPDAACFQLKYADGAQEFLLKAANGNLSLDDQVGGSVTLFTGYTVGTWIEILTIVGNGQATFHVWLPDGTKASVTRPVSGGCHFKDGCYSLANQTNGTGFAETEIMEDAGWFTVPSAFIVAFVNAALGGTTWQSGGSGAAVTSGSADPSSAPASAGLFYLNTTSGDLFYSKAASVVGDWIKILRNDAGTSIATKATPILADTVFQFDSAASDAPVISTWTQILAALKIVTLDSSGRLVNPKVIYTSFNAGSKASGTFTPVITDGNLQHCTNDGAFTLAPQASIGTVVIEMTNGAAAGAITTSGFTKVKGDALTTTNGHKFLLTLTRTQTYTRLIVEALQ